MAMRPVQARHVVHTVLACAASYIVSNIAQRALKNFDHYRAFAAAAVSSCLPALEHIKPLGPSYQEILGPLLKKIEVQLATKKESNVLYTSGEFAAPIAMKVVISKEPELASIGEGIKLSYCGDELGVYLFYGSLEHDEMRYFYQETKALVEKAGLRVKAELTGYIEESYIWQLMCPTSNEVQNKLLTRKAGHIAAATLLTLLVHHYAAARHLKKIAFVGTAGTALGTAKGFCKAKTVYPLKPPYDGAVKRQIEALGAQIKTAGDSDQLYTLYYQHENLRVIKGTKTEFGDDQDGIQLNFPPTQTPRAIISNDLSDNNCMRYFLQQAKYLFREQGIPIVANIDGFVKGIWIWEALRCT